MKHLNKILIICGILLGKIDVYPQILNVSNPTVTTFKISNGESIVLHGNSDYSVAYQWFKDTVMIKGAIYKDLTTNVMGTYSMIAFNAEGCPSAKSDNINVILMPVDSSIIKPDTVVDLAVNIKSTNINAIPGESYDYVVTASDNSPIDGTGVQVKCVLSQLLSFLPETINNSQVIYNADTRTLQWSIAKLEKNNPQSLNIHVTVVRPGMVQSFVTIMGAQQDPLTDNNTSQIVQQANPLFISNVFTPNGDGVNDTFFIPGLEMYSETELSIMNRAGSNVYYKKNYNNDWTGEGLAEGTYFYILKGKRTIGDWNVYKGYITILRTRM
jgi:gliding motility-associated-like protein